MGDTQSAEREDATEETSAHGDEEEKEKIAEGKPFQNIGPIPVLTGKTEDPIAEANCNFKDDVEADVHGKSPATVTPKEESVQIKKTLKDDETSLGKVKINMKESPDAGPEQPNVTDTEARLNEINEGFKTFLNTFGLKLTVKRNSDAKLETSDEPVDTMKGEPSSPDNVRETTDDTTSKNFDCSTDLNTAQETLDNDSTSCPTMTDITSEDIQEKAEGKNAEATEVTEQDSLDKVAEGEPGSSTISKEETTIGVYQLKDGAMSQISPDEEVIYLVKKFFTTGIFSGLRKKKKKKRSHIGNSNDDTTGQKELADMAKHNDDQTEHDQEETRHKDSPSVPTDADCTEKKENATSTNAPHITVNEQELLSSHEKVKVQDSPLKKMLSGSSFKKQSQRKSSDSKLSDSGEHLIVNVSEKFLSSTESTENQREHSPAESPEELTQEEEGAWASFKKLVTPKRHMKKGSLTNEDAIIVGTLVEPKPTGEEQIPDGSTEETKKRKDSTVSWEALLCRSGRRRSGKTSDSEDDQNYGDDYRPNRESRHPAESPLECSHEAYENLAEELSDVDGGSTWKSFKKLVTPKRKAKEEECKDQVISDSENNKDDDSFSIKKLLPGCKKRKSADKQDQVSSDEADRGVESDEDSETPAVVPLSEFNEPVDQIQTQVVIESPINANHEPQKDLSKQITELDLPTDRQVELKRAQDTDALKHSASNKPVSNDTVEDTTEFLSKHQQLSDIPEEGIIEESMATPGSANEAAIRDDTIAEDLIELTSEAVTAPEPVDVTLADETEMISAVSQLTDSSKTSGNTTPVLVEYEVREIEECLNKVVETISVTIVEATATTGLTVEKMVASSSPQILVMGTKKEEIILELHKDSETTAIGHSAKESEGIDKIAETPKTEECLSENTEAISSEQVSEDTTEFYTAGIAVDEVHQADISPIEECNADHRHLEAKVCEIMEASTEVYTTEVEAVTVKSDEGSAEVLVQLVITEDITAIDTDNDIGSVTEGTQQAHQTESSVTEEKEDKPLHVETNAEVEHVPMTQPSVSSVTDDISKMEVQPCVSVGAFIENADDGISQELEQKVIGEHTLANANNAIASAVNEVNMQHATLTEQGLGETEDTAIENDPYNVSQNALLEKERKLSEVADELNVLVAVQVLEKPIPVHDTENVVLPVIDYDEKQTVTFTEHAPVEKENVTIENTIPQHIVAVDEGQVPEVSNTFQDLTCAHIAAETSENSRALVKDDVEKEGLKLTEQTLLEKEHIQENEPQKIQLNAEVVEELSQVAEELQALVAAPVASAHAETYVEVLEGQIIIVTNELQELAAAHIATEMSETSSALIPDKQAIPESISVPDDEHSTASDTGESIKETVIFTEKTAVEKEPTTIEDDPCYVAQHTALMKEEPIPEALPALTDEVSQTEKKGKTQEVEEHLTFEHIPFSDTQEVPLNVIIKQSKAADNLQVLVAAPVTSVQAETNVEVVEEQIISENIPENVATLVMDDVEKESVILAEHTQTEEDFTKENITPQHILAVDEGQVTAVTNELQELTIAHVTTEISETSSVLLAAKQDIAESIPVLNEEHSSASFAAEEAKETVIFTEKTSVEKDPTAIEDDPSDVAQHSAVMKGGQTPEVTEALTAVHVPSLDNKEGEAQESEEHLTSEHIPISEFATGSVTNKKDIPVLDTKHFVTLVKLDVEKEALILTEQALVEKEQIEETDSQEVQLNVVVEEGKLSIVADEIQVLVSALVPSVHAETNVEDRREQIISESIPVTETDNVTFSVMDDVEKKSGILTEHTLMEKKDFTIENTIPQHNVNVVEGQLTDVLNELQELTIAHIAIEISETSSSVVTEKPVISETIPVHDEEYCTASVTAENAKETVIFTEQTAVERIITTEDSSEDAQHSAIMKGGQTPEMTEALPALPAVYLTSHTDKEGEEQEPEEHNVTNEGDMPILDTKHFVTLVKLDVEKEALILTEQALVEKEHLQNIVPQEVPLNVVVEEEQKLSDVADEIQVLVAAPVPSVHAETNVDDRGEQIISETIPVTDTKNVTASVMDDVEKESVIMAENILMEKDFAIESCIPRHTLAVDGHVTEIINELQELTVVHTATEIYETISYVVTEKSDISENIPIHDEEHSTASVTAEVAKKTVTFTEKTAAEKELTTIEEDSSDVAQHTAVMKVGQTPEVTEALPALTAVHVASLTDKEEAHVVEEHHSSEHIPFLDSVKNEQNIPIVETEYVTLVKNYVENEALIQTEQALVEKEHIQETEAEEVHLNVLEEEKQSEVEDELQVLVAAPVESMHYATYVDVLEEQSISEIVPVTNFESVSNLLLDDVEKKSVILAEHTHMDNKDSTIANKISQHIVLDERQVTEVTNELQGLMIAHIANEISETISALVTDNKSISENIPVPDEEITTTSVTADEEMETVIFTEQTSVELKIIEVDPSEVDQHTAVMKGRQIPEVTEALPALTAVHVASLTDKEEEAQRPEEHLTSEHIPLSDSVTNEKNIPVETEYVTLNDGENAVLILTEQARIQETEANEVHLNVLEEEKQSEVADELQVLVIAPVAFVHSAVNVEVLDEKGISKNIPATDIEIVSTLLMDDVENKSVILTEHTCMDKEDSLTKNIIPEHIVAVDEGQVTEVTSELHDLTIVHIATEISETSSVVVTDEQAVSESIPVPDEENSTASVPTEYALETAIFTEQTSVEKEPTIIEDDTSDIDQHTTVMKKGQTPEVTQVFPALTDVHPASLADKEGEARELEEHLTSEHIPFSDTEYATGSATNEKVLNIEHFTLVKDDVEKRALTLTEQVLVDEVHIQELYPQEISLNVIVKGNVSEVADELQVLVAAPVQSVHADTNVEILQEQILSENIPANVATLVMDDVEKESVILAEHTQTEEDLTIENTIPQHTVAMDEGQVTAVTNELQELTITHVMSEISETSSVLVTDKKAISENIPVHDEENSTASFAAEDAAEDATTTEDDPSDVAQHTAVMKGGQIPEVTEALPALTVVHVASLTEKESEVQEPEEHLTSEHSPFSDTEYATVSATNEKDSPVLDIENVTLVKDDVENEAHILTEQDLAEKEHIQEIDPDEVPLNVLHEAEGKLSPEVTVALPAVNSSSLTNTEEAQELEKHRTSEHLPFTDIVYSICSFTNEKNNPVLDTENVTLVKDDVEKEAHILTEQAIVEKEHIHEIDPQEVEQKSIENYCNNVAQHIVISDEGQVAAVRIASLMLKESRAKTFGNAVATAADEVNVEGQKEFPGVKIEEAEVEHDQLIKVNTSNLKDMASMPDASILETSDIPEHSTDVMATDEEYNDIVDSVRTLPLTVEDETIKTADKVNVVVMYMPSIQLEDNHSVDGQVVDPAETALGGVADAKEIIDICHSMDNEDNLANLETDEKITEETNQVILHNVTQHEMANLPDIQGEEDSLHTESSAMLDESVTVEPKSSKMIESAQCKVVVDEVKQMTGMSFETCIETKAQNPYSVEPTIATAQEKDENEITQISEIVSEVSKEEEFSAELTNESNVHLLVEELAYSSEEASMQKLVKEQILQTNSCQVIISSNIGIIVPQNTGLLSSAENVESPSSLSKELKLNVQFEKTKAPDTRVPLKEEKTGPIKLTDVSEIRVQLTEKIESIRGEPEVLGTEPFKQMPAFGVQVTEKTEPIKEPESPKCLKQRNLSEVGVQVTESVQLLRQTETTEIAICKKHAALSDVAIQVTEIIGPTSQLESTKWAVILGQTKLIEVGTKPNESAQQTKSLERTVMCSKPVSELGVQVTETIQPATQTKITEKDMIPTEPFLDHYKQVCVEGIQVLQQVQTEEEYDQEVWQDAEETVYIQGMLETVESLESTVETHKEEISNQDVAQMEEAKNLEDTPRVEGSDEIESEVEDFAVALEHPDMKISETSITLAEWD